MGTVTGLTAERMLAIEAASVVNGDVDANGNLILIKQNGSTIDAGYVKGAQGIPGTNAAPGSVTVVGDTTPIRTNDGRIKTAVPTAAEDATTKAFVNAADVALGVRIDGVNGRADTLDNLVKGVEIGANVDLNTIIPTGVYIQSDAAEVTLALNYPIVAAGLLEVFTNPAGTLFWQRYTVSGASSILQVWVRTIFDGVLSAWKSVLTDTGWVDATLQNGWVNYAGGYVNASYRLKNGVVFIRGLIKNGTITGGTLLFTLPAAYWPSANSINIVPAYSTGSARIDVMSDGRVIGQSGLVSTFTSLSIPAWPIN